MRMNNTAKLFLRYLFWTLCVALMVYIFMHSSKNAVESSSISASFTSEFLSFFSKKFREMSVVEQQVIVRGLSHFVRKLAHFTVYFCLGATSFSAICTYDLKRYTKIISAFMISACYAVSDEVHQTFVDGRAGRVSDVLLDSAGAVCGIFFVISIILLFKKTGKGKYESGKKG